MTQLLANSLPRSWATELIEQLGWVWIHSLWQFSLIALLALIGLWALRHCTSSARDGMLLAIMSLSLVIPVATWFTVASIEGRDASGLASQSYTAATSSGISLVAGEPIQQPADGSLRSGAPAVEQYAAVQMPVFDGYLTTKAGVSSYVAHAVDVLRPWLSTIVGLWCAGVLVFTCRPLLGWLTIRKLQAGGLVAVPPPVQTMLQCLGRKLKVRWSVRVLCSERVITPLVFGCFRSTILLPASLVTGIPSIQLEAILAHELVHVRRCDFMANLFQTLIETVFFYHPAIWWLSHRLRIEREYRCDDLALKVVGDRVSFGRALLAVQEHRQATLALSAADGSLTARIHRLFLPQLSAQTSRGGFVAGFASAGVTAAMATVLVIVSWLTVTAEVTIATDVPSHESNELQARLIVLSPRVDDLQPDLQLQVSKFDNSREMTFGLELTNRGTEPVALAGLRHRAAAADFYPTILHSQLFKLDIQDAQGNPIGRPHRQFTNGWEFMLDSPAVSELQPGESTVVVLRPGRFWRMMDYELPAGDYQVRVRYCGLSDAAREKLRALNPNDPLITTWNGEIESNHVAVTIATNLRRIAPDQLNWGKAENGLRAALELHAPHEANRALDQGRLEVPAGSTIEAIYHVQNVSNEPITLVTESPRQLDRGWAIDETGTILTLNNSWQSGWPISIRCKLNPGETVQIPAINLDLDSLKAGTYIVDYDIDFNNSHESKDEADTATRIADPEDYKGKLITGKAQLVLF